MDSQIRLVQGDELPAGHDFMVISTPTDGVTMFLREGASLGELAFACAAEQALSSVSA